jgi:hypothetical protein
MEYLEEKKKEFGIMGMLLDELIDILAVATTKEEVILSINLKKEMTKFSPHIKMYENKYRTVLVNLEKMLGIVLS